MKTCTKCKTSKPLSEFCRNKNSKDGLCLWCKSCQRISQDNWIENNRDKANAMARKWKINHPEHARRYMPNWKSRNKTRTRGYSKRYRSTLKGSLNSRMAGGMWDELRNKKAKRKWETLVGYTVSDLKRHFESKFTPGMSWENMGQWHIDHIIPLSFFHYNKLEDQEFQYCWSLDNLQPLWAKDNLRKSNKITRRFV